MSLIDKDTKTKTDYVHKTPDFDRDTTPEFKCWQDNNFSQLETEDIEECVKDVQEDIRSPTKVYTELPADRIDVDVAAMALEQEPPQNGKTKSNARVARVTK